MKGNFYLFLGFIFLLMSCKKEVAFRPDPAVQHKENLKELPDSGLIALYEFSGNADDGSGNGNNGTLHGGVTLCNDRFGNANSAYLFDGVDGSYISTITGGPLGNSPRSVCFWVKSTSLNMQYLVSYGDIIQIGRSFGTGLNNPCAGIGFDNGFGVAMRGNETLLDGQWHQLVIVFDAVLYGPTVSDGQFYIDGFESNVINCSAVFGQSPINTLEGKPFVIGSDLDYGRVLEGCIDDIRIYNRALSPEEIFAIFNAPDPHPKWWAHNGTRTD
jgi:hypothetical protein